MSINVIHYVTKPDRADENQQLIEKVFTELAERAPDTVRYASFRLDDGVTFVHIVEEDGGESVFAHLEAFAAFQAGFADRAAAGPDADGATVVGSYRFLD